MFGWFSSSPNADKPNTAVATSVDACPVPIAKEANPLNPQGLKPCCACPETKSARDACFLKFDTAEADEKCKWLVKAHIDCMKSYGFKV
ncbi:hypothetical protein M407DRAFT_246005 [Tulasnella calospora MUT 4182]|uniref:Cytochrome c oxidase copper chaperone n=1 Tax=Tulasnella calospora MUT 4182 TaxID=1051891 RepID=A0A0C3Q7G0_9AGAM|nr:hypothetical protein M407DRAFT_246005 [Tulasnella calospora MUT 4182]